MELEVYTKDGASAGRKIKVSKKIFSAEPNEHAVYLAVNAQRVNSRQGTASTKTRSMVSGGGKKPWKQKGRGTARAGSSRSPIWRGGGITHGPQPHPYHFRLPKKVKQVARISVLSAKVKDEQVKVLEDFNIEQPKTKEVVTVLKGFGLENTKTLLLLSEYNKDFWLAGRNIKNLNIVLAQDASTLDLLDCKAMLVMESAVKKLEGILAK
ncbi:50S ribosomal protein L4 [candidate division KSB1 bacterium]|nr:50S ribosomal protein L4 [candidate division KSB1 bacterium]